MSYFEIVDYTNFDGVNPPRPIKTAQTIEEANTVRNQLSDSKNVLRIIKKFEFKWQDSDRINNKSEF